MLKFLAKLTVLGFFGVLAGCTADWDPARQGRLHAAAHHPQAPDVVVQSDRMGLAAGRRSSKFATLPDRGELAVYDTGAKPRVSGAYSAYPVHLSEEHALKAAHAGGHMVIRAPDGKTIMLAYERHVEHPDGNWTWIGRDAQGADAVITFGEEAAFGTIPQADEDSLRLTMSGGQTWLIATDRNKLPYSDPELTRLGKGDYLIPPKMAVGAVSNKAPTSASAQAGSAAIVPLAGTTVDVVLGYTTGLAAALGGNSQAATRLNNLVEIGNQAYANSGVNATLRLMGTVSVAYPDDTDNAVTLQEMSGYDGQGRPTTPNSAFAGLRAARDTYGADLVSLVRDFRTPQNHGCGIAWLIGGNQAGIEQGDAPFGYSVVSDGSDIDEGDGQTYFCREESLVHELGHNMGQVHNIGDSDNTSGLHAYSYGYRETSTNGFYTIMAYRLSGSSQFAIRNFANPSVLYDGRPTGVANQSDNVRSMGLSIPVVASFRGTPTRARNDMDGNGKSDIVWWNHSLGAMAYWSMNGAQLVSGFNQGFGTALTPSSTGRSTTSGRTDILMRRASDRMLFSFQSQASGFVQYSVGQYGDGWTVAGQGDIDGDGKDDIFLRHTQLGYFAYWLMDGPVYKGGQSYTPPAYYLIAAIADFNGDGRVDIVWNSPGDRTMSMWLSVGSGFTVSQIGQYGADWRLIGAADVTGDNKADLLWRSSNNQYMSYWRMDGAVYLGAYAQGTPTGYELSATGDYNGDGIGDMVWTRPSDRSISMWLGNGTGFAESLIGQYGADWALQP